MELLGAVGQLLPVGLAAALSSVPITVLLVIMLSPRRTGAAVPYVLGCVVGTALVVAVASLAAQVLPDPRPRQARTVLAVIEIVLGGALLALGVRGWRRRHRDHHELQLPGWAMSALDTVTGLRAFALGVLIELRPKSALLACVVGLQVTAAGRDPGPLGVIVIYVVIATSTVTLPVLLTALSPRTMEPRLRSASETISRDGPLISSVVLLMVGAVVIGSGLEDLQ